MSTPTQKANKISFLALGDSYTIGEGVRPAERWPVQLAQMACQEGLPLQAPTIIARTGWTTAALQDAIGSARRHPPYGLVTVMIGVNDQFRGHAAAGFRGEAEQLLRTATGLAGNRPGHVLVLSVPDWGQSPFARRQGRDAAGIAREIDAYNVALQQVCHRMGIAYLDVTDLTRAAADNPVQFARDGLHYSGGHMRQWAGRALPVVCAALE